MRPFLVTASLRAKSTRLAPRALTFFRSLPRRQAAAPPLVGAAAPTKPRFVQALFEGAMYTFVFLWTPALSPKGEQIPHGFIFALFMLASMAGSAIAGHFFALGWKPERYMQARPLSQLSVSCFLGGSSRPPPWAGRSAGSRSATCTRGPFLSCSSGATALPGDRGGGDRGRCNAF